MLQNGFVSLHRKMLNWGWYKNINTKTVFIHLLLTCNYEPHNFQEIVVERGQRIASYETLANETGLSVQQVRTAVKHLKSTGEIICKPTNKYTLFSVVNYDLYQNGQQADQQSNDNQTTSNQHSTNNNEIKNNKNNKSISSLSPVGEKTQKRKYKSKTNSKNNDTSYNLDDWYQYAMSLK